MKRVQLLGGLLLLAGAGLTRAAEAPAPVLSISVRGVADGTIEAGEPLRVAVRLGAPRPATAAIRLAPATGTWSDAITVELAPAAGGAAVAQAVAVGRPESPAAVLDAGHVAGGLWRIAADGTQRLAPGNYVVRARLTLRNGTGWQGEVQAADFPIALAAPSESAERAAQRVVNRAHDALLDGHVREAAGLLDARLEKAPDEARVLLARAEVALRADNPMAALICLNRLVPKAGSGVPPPERETLLVRARAALQGRAATAPNPPAWSTPPAAVLQPTAEMRATLLKNRPAQPGPGGVTSAPAASSGAATTPPVVPAATPTPGPRGTPPGAVISAATLSDAQIRADAAGRWAASATAGSQYGRTQYAAGKAAGAPDVPVVGNSPDAWCPASKDTGTDWLEVTFAQPVPATGVRVRQSDAPGAIVKVEAFAADGTAHLWWEGKDPLVPPTGRDIVWFAVRVPPTAYAVARIKLTLNLAAGPGWKQIDAVQLVAAP